MLKGWGAAVCTGTLLVNLTAVSRKSNNFRIWQVTELKLKVDNVERERDFYFDKLRDIEILCQMPLLQSIPVITSIVC